MNDRSATWEPPVRHAFRTPKLPLWMPQRIIPTLPLFGRRDIRSGLMADPGSTTIRPRGPSDPCPGSRGGPVPLGPFSSPRHPVGSSSLRAHGRFQFGDNRTLRLLRSRSRTTQRISPTRPLFGPRVIRSGPPRVGLIEGLGSTIIGPDGPADHCLGPRGGSVPPGPFFGPRYPHPGPRVLAPRAGPGWP